MPKYLVTGFYTTEGLKGLLKEGGTCLLYTSDAADE